MDVAVRVLEANVSRLVSCCVITTEIELDGVACTRDSEGTSYDRLSKDLATDSALERRAVAASAISDKVEVG